MGFSIKCYFYQQTDCKGQAYKKLQKYLDHQHMILGMFPANDINLESTILDQITSYKDSQSRARRKISGYKLYEQFFDKYAPLNFPFVIVDTDYHYVYYNSVSNQIIWKDAMSEENPDTENAIKSRRDKGFVISDSSLLSSLKLSATQPVPEKGNEYDQLLNKIDDYIIPKGIDLRTAHINALVFSF